MVHLLTGVVTTKAIASEIASEPQNSRSPSCASIASGQSTITPLSISSITAMDSVSAASATRKAVRKSTPARSTPRRVSEYPKKKASTIASTVVARFPQPNAVPITMPSTSPMAHPVRQCRVA